MRRYKTSATQRSAAKARRDAIKAAGGQPYADLLAKERAARIAWRRANPDRLREHRRRDDSKGQPFKTALCAGARQRGRKRGLPATITPADIVWPSHCPVLGIELDYPERSRMRKDRVRQGNWPSLDRWDNTKGYIPGNVFVISMRANMLKSNVSREEILQIAKYVMTKPRYGAAEVPDSALPPLFETITS